VTDITKTIYIDLTDIFLQIERILPNRITEANSQHSFMSFEPSLSPASVVQDFLDIFMEAANDVEYRSQKLQFLLGSYYPWFNQALSSKMGIVFGNLTAVEFHSISQYLAFSFTDNGVVITIPTAEWLSLGQ